MSDALKEIKNDIETILAKFKSSTDLAEKQRLLKEAEFALEKAGEIVFAPLGAANRRSRVRAKTRSRGRGQ